MTNFSTSNPPQPIKHNDDLFNKLQYLWNFSIEEIETNDKIISLIMKEICDLLGPLHTDDKEYNAVYHKRYLHLFLSIVRNVSRTIYYYTPYSTLPFLIEYNILLLLNKGVTPDVYELEELFTISIKEEMKDIEREKGAYAVLYNAISCLSLNKCYEGIRGVIYEILTGDVIFPSSITRRDIYNWLINQAIPSSIYLKDIDYLYPNDIVSSSSIDLELTQYVLNKTGGYRHDLSINDEVKGIVHLAKCHSLALKDEVKHIKNIEKSIDEIWEYLPVLKHIYLSSMDNTLDISRIDLGNKIKE